MMWNENLYHGDHDTARAQDKANVDWSNAIFNQWASVYNTAISDCFKAAGVSPFAAAFGWPYRT